MSPGVSLLYRLASIAATALPDFDAEICEVHHKHKKDAPSGTALRLAEAVAEGGRAQGEIGISAMRAGEIVGEHTLLLAGRGERLELRHVAQDRSCFAVGALRAAAWVHEKQPGLYDMEAVLGLPGLGQ
jgi:4-hydroxy-tetrahydrodipicolinate reductase